MTTLVQRSVGFLREVAGRFSVRRDDGPIDTVAELQRFVASRSAFVAQHKLYGYLKTRIGTRYPAMFENDVFIRSVNLAKLQVYAACLSDLTVHAVARTMAGAGFSRDARAALARKLYRAGIAEIMEGEVEAGDAERWSAGFEERLDDINWDNIAVGGDAFAASPDALLRWAPIAEELKQYDAEIVRNSVRYAWNEVTRSFRRRLDAEALQAELRARGS